MSTLKERIQSDFTTAFKAKDNVTKATLSMLKAEITKVEKQNGNTDLDDSAVIKVILSCCKQRKQSIEEFTKGGRTDLAANEAAELKVLEQYLPAQMSPEEAKQHVVVILEGFADVENRQKKIGSVMGKFNKQFSGLFDNASLKQIVEELVP